MRVLVTGGAGFIGSYLVPRLLERGDEVVVFDMAPEPKALAPVMDRIGYVRGDLGSAPDLYRAMMSCRPEGVFHLGAILAGPLRRESGAGVPGQLRLDPGAAGCGRGLEDAASSSWSAPSPSSAATRPSRSRTTPRRTPRRSTARPSSHPNTCCPGTRASTAWTPAPCGSPGCSGRVAPPGSPRSTPRSILDAIARGEAVSVPNPEERGDWLYVKDAVKAILLVWDRTSPPQRIYNIAGGVHSIREVVAIAQRLRPAVQGQLAGRRPEPVPLPGGLRRPQGAGGPGLETGLHDRGRGCGAPPVGCGRLSSPPYPIRPRADGKSVPSPARSTRAGGFPSVGGCGI